MCVIQIIPKGHNSMKKHIVLQFLFSAQCHDSAYVCTKFSENVLNGLKLIADEIFILTNRKGQSSEKL